MAASVRLLALVAILLASTASHAEPLRAGVARSDITPPLALKASLGGYGERMSRPATGVHDRLWAKALVLASGPHRRALVTADVLAFPPGFRTAVAAALASDGWREDELLLLASHTHAGPDMTAMNPRNVFGIAQLGIYHPELTARLVGQIAETVRDAARQPVPVGAASSTRTLTGFNRNRRGAPETDPDLTLLRIDTLDGKPLAVFVNWTAHPTFLGAGHMEFSGEWPGHLQRTLETLIGDGVTVLYGNGAEGDQSPTPRLGGGPAWEQVERYGRELAVQAWETWRSASPRPDTALAWSLETVTLPERRAHPDFMRTGGTEYGLTPATVGPLLDALCPARTHCTALRIGDLVIVGIPGEMAAGLGLEVKRAARARPDVRHVAIGGLADEWISYMLSPAEYRKGGYEASVSFYGDNLGPVLVETARRAVAALP